MIKKMAAVTLGVAAGLVVAAPLASAQPVSGGPGAGGDCTFTGDDGSAESVITDSPLNALLQAPVAGDNAGYVGRCSVIGQGNEFPELHLAGVL